MRGFFERTLQKPNGVVAGNVGPVDSANVDVGTQSRLRDCPSHSSETISRDVLTINAGSLYPALQRLQKQKWLSAEWKVSENKQDVKVYTLTAAGKRQLTQERSRWEQITGAVAGVLNPATKKVS